VNPLNYYFYEVTHCNMCGADTQNHKILGQRLNQSQGLRPKRKRGITTTIMQCTTCSLIYSRPQPVPYDIQKHYGIPPEDYWRPEYFMAEPAYFLNVISKAKKLLPFQPGMKALDIGAGIGKGLVAMGDAGFDAYGLEPSAAFHERAVQLQGISPEKLKKGMMEEVDFEPGTFDLITFNAVLEHLYDPDKAIAKAIEWLKPKGLIHIEVPSSKYLMSRIFNRYFRLMGTNYVTNTSPMHSPFHMYEFGLKSFEENRKKNHYSIAHSEYYVCNILKVPKIFHPLLKGCMKITKRGMQLEIWLKKEESN
jgi:2-polyprenyl-3-methyl-5-hydroxy-6-metoxy-1,4-benzoquinol methylase